MVFSNAESEFVTQRFSGRAYTAEETISFSQNPRTHLADMDEEMRFHGKCRHVQVSGLTQEELELFVEKYANSFSSIYFFQNPKIRDLSALSSLRRVEYLLFFNLRMAEGLWDMSQNLSLKGLMIAESKRMVYELSAVSKAPVLEEFLLFSCLDRKYTVRSLSPLRECPALKRAMLECNTENRDFAPRDFSRLEVFKYRVDGQNNFNFR